MRADILANDLTALLQTPSIDYLCLVHCELILSNESDLQLDMGALGSADDALSRLDTHQRKVLAGNPSNFEGTSETQRLGHLEHCSV